MWMKHRITETVWEMTAAAAAPPMPHSRTVTNRITITTFSTQAMIRNTRGVRESPIARIVAAAKLKNISDAAPRNMT